VSKHGGLKIGAKYTGNDFVVRYLDDIYCTTVPTVVRQFDCLKIIVVRHSYHSRIISDAIPRSETRIVTGLAFKLASNEVKLLGQSEMLTNTSYKKHMTSLVSIPGTINVVGGRSDFSLYTLIYYEDKKMSVTQF